MQKKSDWLLWTSEIQAIAQTGLAYAKCDFDKQRYDALLQICAQMMASQSSVPLQSIVDLFSGELGYATPKIDVRGAVFKNNQILLVKERSDQKWTLPGGFADVNYSPAYCVQKEIQEESGFEVKVNKLVALYDKLKHEHPPQWPHVYKCFFLCEIMGGEAQTSVETCEVAFFDIHSLPPLSVHRVTGTQIAKCYQHYLDPHLPTEFD